MSGMTPSSPRLPSPPPPAENMLGPKSPAMGATATRQAQMEQLALDANAKRRIHRGTKAADMATGPPLVPLNELDSPFQLQEHLAALHWSHTAHNTMPMTRETSRLLAAPPPNTDRTLWLYELCRFLIKQCNDLIVGFFSDNPPCSAATCPEMRASEWQFLCAVHEQPKSCCAIDYCCHTLDWAANVVTNTKIFPSRFTVATDAHDRNVAMKNLVNVFRRIHRVFAHAWFQHRGVFWTVEGRTGFYVFFKTVCDVYDLLPAENYKLPPEAEGLPGDGSDGAQQASAQLQPPFAPLAIQRPYMHGGESASGSEESSMGRSNTRRHIRSSPSTGSAVTTVMEADEHDEEGWGAKNRNRGLNIAAPSPVVEEREVEPETEGMDIPVIVEQAAMAQPGRPSSVVPIEPAPSAQPVTNVESATAATQAADEPKDDVEDDSDAETTVMMTSADDDADKAEEEEPSITIMTFDGATDSKDASNDEGTASEALKVDAGNVEEKEGAAGGEEKEGDVQAEVKLSDVEEEEAIKKDE